MTLPDIVAAYKRHEAIYDAAALLRLNKYTPTGGSYSGKSTLVGAMKTLMERKVPGKERTYSALQVTGGGFRSVESLTKSQPTRVVAAFRQKYTAEDVIKLDAESLGALNLYAYAARQEGIKINALTSNERRRGFLHTPQSVFRAEAYLRQQISAEDSRFPDQVDPIAHGATVAAVEEKLHLPKGTFEGLVERVAIIEDSLSEEELEKLGRKLVHNIPF